MHWKRKHMGDLAMVASRLSGDPSTTEDQLIMLQEMYLLSQGIAKNVRECSHENVSTVVRLLCTACKTGLPGEPCPTCNGRSDWQTPCDLVRRHLIH